MKNRLPRKLKKERKKDGVQQLMNMSIPIVRQIIDFPSRRILTELLTVGAFNPDTFKDVYGNK